MKAAPNEDQPSPSRPPWVSQYPRTVDWLLDIPVRPVHALLDEAVAAFAARPFLDFFGRRQTYAQTARLIAKAALGFQRLGVRKGTKVGLLLPNCPYSVICYFAILKAGGTVVNYDPLCAERELIRQIEDSETDIMVTLDLTALYGKVAAARAKTNLRRIVICKLVQAFPFFRGLMFRLAHWWEVAKPSRGTGDVLFDALIDNDGSYEEVEIAPLSDVAVIQYTGGTTGEPKGVMLSHQNIYANTCQNRAWFTRAEPGRERLLAIIPFSHSFGMTAVMNFAISLGGELVLFPRFDLKQTLRAIERKRVTILLVFPPFFRQSINVRKSSATTYHRSRFAFPAVIPCRVQCRRSLLSSPDALWPKATASRSAHPSSPAAIHLRALTASGSCGLPLPQTTVEIVSLENPRKVLPNGERGEICISGPQVMLGYWRAPKATRNCLIDGRLHTGDVGWMDADGFLYFVDRLKEIISVHGYKVYPRNVEDSIRLHPAVIDVAVIGVSDPIRGQAPKAYVVLAKGAQLSEGEIQAFLADKLSPIETPRLFEFRTDLPKSAAGKILKRSV